MTETITSARDTILVFADGVNADNPACAWGAVNAFPDSEVLVVVSGTPAHFDENAGPREKDFDASRTAQEIHTSRMAGLFGRVGLRDCVYYGLPPEEDGIQPIIPYNVHSDHAKYDVMHDYGGEGQAAIAGSFGDLILRLEQGSGTIRVVVGGPFSEVPYLIDNPLIALRLAELAGQVGFDLSERTMFAETTFNGDANIAATLYTLLKYPGTMLCVPSDITRRPEVTFDGYQALQGIYDELYFTFAAHRRLTEPRNEVEQQRRKERGEPLLNSHPLAIHDLQAVMALNYALGHEDPGLYTFAPVNIPQAIDNLVEAARRYEVRGFERFITSDTARSMGYLGGNTTVSGEIPPRLEVVAQDGELFKSRVPQLLGPLLRAA